MKHSVVIVSRSGAVRDCCFTDGSRRDAYLAMTRFASGPSAQCIPEFLLRKPRVIMTLRSLGSFAGWTLATVLRK